MLFFDGPETQKCPCTNTEKFLNSIQNIFFEQNHLYIALMFSLLLIQHARDLNHDCKDKVTTFFFCKGHVYKVDVNFMTMSIASERYQTQ